MRGGAIVIVDDTSKDISGLYRSSRRYCRQNRDLLINAVTVENVANGWLRNLETQFDELALDFAVSTARVFPGKSENEFLNFHTDRWSPTLVFVWIGPFRSN